MAKFCVCALRRSPPFWMSGPPWIVQAVCTIAASWSGGGGPVVPTCWTLFARIPRSPPCMMLSNRGKRASPPPPRNVLNVVQFLMPTIVSQLFYFIYYLLHIFESYGRIVTILDKVTSNILSY